MNTIISLQSNGSNLLDMLATLLDFVGGSIFFLVILLLIFWCINRQLGMRLLFSLLLAGVLLMTIKQITDVDRPYVAHPEAVTKLFDEETQSFPSGHVTLSIAIWGAGVLYLGKLRWLLSVAILALFMAWSRMYAGVHYPTDILGGVVLGVLVMVIVNPLVDVLADLAQGTSRQTHVAAVVLASIVSLVMTSTSAEGAALAGLVLGMGMGLIVESWSIRFVIDGATRQRILRYAVGIVLVVGVFFALNPFTEDDSIIWNVPLLALIGFMATAAYPWLAQRIGLMQTVNQNNSTA